ncbi:MAG TPA: L,D-transpeptidase family protein [Fimbriimonadaceae bacterium]|nr:L,D-transpeptidase family protein [Fimbriimonadaceae bacterium]
MVVHGIGLFVALAGASQDTLETVVLPGQKGFVQVPIRRTSEALGLTLHADAKTGAITINDRPITPSHTLPGRITLMKVRDLEPLGVQVSYDAATELTTLSFKDKTVTVKPGEKRVVVNKSEQKLRAYQGGLLVFETRVSTGKRGHGTPSGSFTAGPEKSVFRRSSLYENSPMPFSIQIEGHVFMHGYHSVPRYPASHGCIRLPMTGKNAAKWLFKWVDLGTPITVGNSWDES